MRDIKEHLLTPIILFFVLLIDGQISTFLANILPLQWHLVSHFIFIFMLFLFCVRKSAQMGGKNESTLAVQYLPAGCGCGAGKGIQRA